MKIPFLIFCLLCGIIFLNQTITAQGLSIGDGTAFNLGGAILSISNDWSNSGTFNEETGTVILNGAGNTQSITNSNGEVFTSLTINKTSGSVSLNDSITVNGNLTITSGNIVTNSYTLFLGTSASLTGESAGNYVKGNLQVTANVGANQSTAFNGSGVNLGSAAEDLGNVTLIRISGAAVTLNGNTSIKRRWKLNSQNALTILRNITLAWTSDDDNGKNIISMQGWLSNDDFATIGGTSSFGSVQDCSSRSVILTLSSLPASQYTSLSFAETGSPLPVQLVSFKAVLNADYTELNWSTAGELNNYGFEIERLTTPYQGGVWVKVGFVQGHGNSSSPQQYSFEDKNPPVGKVQYRLKQIDTDGKFIYSDIMEIVISPPARFAVEQNFPNPFNPTTTIRYQIPAARYVILKVYDILGKEVATLVDSYQNAGIYNLIFNADMEGLASGTYIYKLSSGSSRQTHKMILMK